MPTLLPHLTPTEEALALRYQPIVHLGSGALHAMEAVVPQRGSGPWVVAAVARQAREWADRGMRPVIALRAAPRELAERSYAKRLTEVLARHDVSPRRFMLQVAETAMHDAAARPAIERARRMGVLLALDDFGTGELSLARLRELPVDMLKIDGSLVARAPADPWAEGVVRAIAALGRGLGMGVVAKGIETIAQRALAERAGCMYGQAGALGDAG